MNEDLRENWASLRCGECTFFRVNADCEGVVSKCKRIDHKKIRFAVPWFKSYDCGQFNSNVCRDFEPAKRCKYLYDNWSGFDEYYGGISDKETIEFTLNGDTTVRYKIKYLDFVNNTFLDSKGNLKWIERYYQKRVKVSLKNPTGYEFVYEKNRDYREKTKER